MQKCLTAVGNRVMPALELVKHYLGVPIAELFRVRTKRARRRVSTSGHVDACYLFDEIVPAVRRS